VEELRQFFHFGVVLLIFLTLFIIRTHRDSVTLVAGKSLWL